MKFTSNDNKDNFSKYFVNTHLGVDLLFELNPTASKLVSYSNVSYIVLLWNKTDSKKLFSSG